MKLAIGTVQFGLSYGIANQSGQVGFPEAVKLLEVGSGAGIDTLDTAIAYGESEQVLGRIGIADWRVVTKLPTFNDDGVHGRKWIIEQVKGSLDRLRVGRLYAVLLHRPEQLFCRGGADLLEGLRALKAEGLTEKIGVSVYAPDEFERLFNLMKFDLVQVPLSIMDRRLVEKGWAKRLKALGVEIHTRSVFLQGLLLMSRSARPEKFRRWEAMWQIWSSWLADSGLSELEACVRYSLSIDEIDRVVIGLDNSKQLRDILAVPAGKLPSLPNWPEPIDPVLINPSAWSQL